MFVGSNLGWQKYRMVEVLPDQSAARQKCWLAEVLSGRNVGRQKYWMEEILFIQQMLADRSVA
jgi:hypothetical protein